MDKTKKIIVRRSVSSETLPLDQNLHPTLQRIYLARGITSAEQLDRSLTHLLPYHSLLGISEAAHCLAETLTAQRRILIVGDFDADGATSSALAVSALRAFGAQQVHYLVPNRFEYGYGLTPEIVSVAANWQPNVIVTVDNGIASCTGVAAAKALGIKVIITDHHLAGTELPAADAIVNPNQPGDLFPSKSLAGVGVIFYVMLALRTLLREQNWFVDQNIAEPNMSQFLDLVALGTVADMAPLDQNNRILVHQGIQRIRARKCRLGILVLLQIAGKTPEKVAAVDLGFTIGPRLNAAGRLHDMSVGIECLLSHNFPRAQQLAVQLDQLNHERRVIESTMQKQAQQALARLKLDNHDLPMGLCLFDEEWHQGVIGILASRLKEQLHRPVIVFARGSEREIKGSARSVAGLHIRDILEAIATRHPDLIKRFGGHAMAAGLTLERDCYPVFCLLFDEAVRQQLSQEKLRGEICSDGELASGDFRVEFAELLRNAGPWGQAFPEPLFDGKFHLISQRMVTDKHLKLLLRDSNSSQELDAIVFNVDLDQWPLRRCEFVRVAYRLDINEYRGQRSVQLVVEHLEEEV